VFNVSLHAALTRFTSLPENRPRKNEHAEFLASKTIPKWYALLCFVVTSFTLLGGIVGFVGLFILWKRAPVIYCSALFGKIFLKPLFNPVVVSQNCWEELSATVEYVLDGFIMALIFFGPAKHLFS
jgi:hypothetical protein